MAKRVLTPQDVTGWEVIAPLPTLPEPPKSPPVTNVVAPRAYREDDGPLYDDDDPFAPALSCEFCVEPDPGCGCWQWKKKFGERDYSC